MKIKKFNEGIGDDVDISNERVNDILLEMNKISEAITNGYDITSNLYMELSKYKTKSSKENDQIDDAVINLELFKSKLNESSEIIVKINSLLEDYVDSGRKFIF